MMRRMAEVTYDVKCVKTSQWRWEYTTTEHMHHGHTTTTNIIDHGHAWTESHARHKATRFIRRRITSLKRPIEVWA